MPRARILLRVGDRVWWEEHLLSGYGATPDEAIESYRQRMRDLAADGLEPATTPTEPRSTVDRGHSWPADAVEVRGYHHGHGIVRLRKCLK